MPTTLDLDDIQHFLLTRTPALAARYEFLSFRNAAEGQAWLSGLVDKVGSGRSVGNATPDARWVTVAFTCNGLRALGVDEAALATFPEEFRMGMAARWEVNVDEGKDHPEHWGGGVGGEDLLAIAILFARDAAERDRCTREHQRYLSQCGGVDVLSSL